MQAEDEILNSYDKKLYSTVSLPTRPVNKMRRTAAFRPYFPANVLYSGSRRVR